MKKSTIVLTAASLAAALLGTGKVSSAQSLTTLTAKGYDATLAAGAVSASATSDEQALLAAVNAARAANGVPALTLDPALAAAARYQEADQVKLNFYGPFAYLADGATPVAPTTLAADFASQAAGVGDTEFSTIMAPGDTGNWPALVKDWAPQDASFAHLLSDSSVNAAGVSIVAVKGRFGGVTYRWALLFGHVPVAGAPPPPLNIGSLDTVLAPAAVSAAPTADEQALLAAVNVVRAANGVPALTLDPALSAAARYQEADQVKLNFYGPFAYLADGATPVAPTTLAADFASQAAGVGDTEFTTLLAPGDTGNWPALVKDWAPQDASFAHLLGDSSVNAAGVSIVAVKGRFGGVTYRWALLFGHDPVTGAPAPVTAPAPTLNLNSLDQDLAPKAQAAGAPTSAEQALLAAVNGQRAANGQGALALDPTLNAAAHYQALDQVKVSFLGPWAYQGDGTTQVQPGDLAADFASPVGNVHDFAYSTGNSGGRFLSWSKLWARQMVVWSGLDSSGFGAMLNSGAYNVCGVAVVTLPQPEVYNGVSYPVSYYTLMVGRK